MMWMLTDTNQSFAGKAHPSRYWYFWWGTVWCPTRITAWMRNPFCIDMESITLPSNEEHPHGGAVMWPDDEKEIWWGNSFPRLVQRCDGWVSIPHNFCSQNAPTIQHNLSVWKWLFHLVAAQVKAEKQTGHWAWFESSSVYCHPRLWNSHQE